MQKEPFILAVILGLALSACNTENETTAAEAQPASTASANLPAVTTNHEWQPVISEINNVEMALAPAGCFLMGTTEQQARIDQNQCNAEITNCAGVNVFDETPQHEVCIEEPFWIDRYEVSNADFGRASFTEGELPRTLVNWPDAQAHCELRGGRLPTEAEWEYAARGPESWRYPWGGDLPDVLLPNFCDGECQFSWKNDDLLDGYEVAAPIRSTSSDVSWTGAFHMSGNVSEWTHSLYMPFPYAKDGGREVGTLDVEYPRTIRGGSFRSVPNRLRSSFRFGFPPLELNEALGFRCMLPYQE